MTTQQRVVDFLLQPRHYPHAVDRVLHRQTHVSHVFLSGPYAYKLKKAVRFPFLDASSLALRKKFCLLELSLNRRLAPDIYLGLVPVVQGRDGLRLGTAAAAQAPGRVVEWLVRMRRMPEERMLDQLVQRRAVDRRQMEQLMDRLIPFFRRAARSRRIERFGSPPLLRALTLGNLQECQPFVGSLLSEADRHFIERAYHQYLALHEPLLRRRIREGRIIDGHGDLRCENICVEDGQIQIFDCVEFQPAFRCGDMASDLSFLIMDLEFRGRRDLASILSARYKRSIQDPTFEAVLPLYQCHRSLVRAKVRAFAWQQHPTTRAGVRVQGLSRRHFKLARHYAAQCAPPRLIVIGGLIGSGKSTLARSLAEALGAHWLRSDEIRVQGFGRFRRAGQGFAEGLYSSRVSEMVYQRLIQQAAKLVRRGESVVCDGTFSKARGRGALRQVARRSHASFHFFECVVPRAVSLRRVAARAAARSDISEARPEHYDRLKAGFERVRGWGARDWTRLSDNRPAAQTHQAALRALRQAWGIPV